MAKVDYIPKTDNELRAWLGAFNTNIQIVGPAVGISPTELDSIDADITALIAQMAEVHSAKAALKGLIASKAATARRVIRDIRKHSSRIKTHPDYSAVVAVQLGIVREKSRWNAVEARPVLRAKTLAGKVMLGYKKEQSHGVQIWCKRGNETSYSLLALDMRSPFYDNRANLTDAPEERHYYAFFVDSNDEVIGQRSNVVAVKV